MIIINIKIGDNLERALKTLKSKVIKTKQNQKLFKVKITIKLILQDFLILRNSFGQIFRLLI